MYPDTYRCMCVRYIYIYVRVCVCVHICVSVFIYPLTYLPTYLLTYLPIFLPTSFLAYLLGPSTILFIGTQRQAPAPPWNLTLLLSCRSSSRRLTPRFFRLIYWEMEELYQLYPNVFNGNNGHKDDKSFFLGNPAFRPKPLEWSENEEPKSPSCWFCMDELLEWTLNCMLYAEVRARAGSPCSQVTYWAGFP